MRKTALAVVLLLPLLASAQRTEYRVLLPVYSPQPAGGAFGSQWKTSYAVHNPTTADFHVNRCPGSSDPQYNGCARILLEDALLEPGETETTLPDFSHDFEKLSSRGGPRLLYIIPFSTPAASPSQLSFGLRALDLSRSGTNAGTEVPVVREEEFRTRTTSLVNVPSHPSFRFNLRLYELKLKVSAFTLRIFDQDTNQLVATKELALSWHFPHHYASMFEPPHLEIGNLADLVPPGTTLPQTMRIEIEPRTPGSEFWAFVSITNNETQHLTLVTPQ